MRAHSEDQVVDIVREARASRRTMEIVGGGTRRGYGRPMQCDDVLDLSGLNGIVDYEPEELILTVKPGTPLDEIEAVLSAKNQRLGFEPQDWRALLGSTGRPTVGGAVSCNANGPAAVRFGRARDHLLGFRAVNGFGEAYKAGGRVVKNVTGFDLPKLMCGAMGTLGPLTELTFRVFPKAPCSAVCTFTGSNGEESLWGLRQIWSGPLEATGLCYRFEDDVAFIRLEGAREVLAQKIALLRGMMSGVEIGAVDEMPTADAAFDGEDDLWRIFVPPANAMDMIAEIALCDWLADWAGGLIWIASDRDLHDVAMRHGGSAMLVRASEETRRRVPPFAPEPPARAKLTRAVKAAFDPLGLFNPGRMFEAP